MKKQVLIGQVADEALFAGVESLYDSVKVTLGPKGRNFLIAPLFRSPYLTHDGVTVAKNFEHENPALEVGASFVRDASRKNATDIGDGTTSTVVMTYHLLKGVQSYYGDRMSLARELKAEADLLTAQLSPLDSLDIKAVASLSAQDRDLGSLVAGILTEVGKDGTVLVERSNDRGMDVEFINGLKIESGFTSPYQANTDKGEARLDDVAVFVSSVDVATDADIGQILRVAGERASRLLIVATDVSRAVTARIHAISDKVHIVAVKAPHSGSKRLAVLKDIAALAGSTLHTEGNPQATHIGRADTITVNADSTTISNPAPESRISELEKELQAATVQRDKDFIKDRIAGLQGKVAVLRVGGRDDKEIDEALFRIEDSILAGRAALDGGVVVGGGITYLSLKTSETEAGNIFAKALREPFNQLMLNSGIATDYTEGVGGGTGVDVSTGELVDLEKAGIVEPLRLVEAVIQTAASTVAALITTGGIIVEIDDDKDA